MGGNKAERRDDRGKRWVLDALGLCNYIMIKRKAKTKLAGVIIITHDDDNVED